jgi:hypothetical protein
MSFDANVDITIKVAFGADPLNVDWATATLADLTSRGRSWSSHRGRQYELDRVEAGTLSLVASNSDGFLNPNNTQSDFYPNVRPMTPIQIVATYDSVDYEVYTGFIESWPPSFPFTGKDAVVQISASDAFEVLAGQRLRGFWPDVIDAETPVAWWRFSDNTDEQGTHDLTYSGTPDEDSDGAWLGDLAVSFDGSDDYATVANEGDLELLADMSFEVWFKPTVATAQTVETFNTDDTWTAPAGVTSVTVELWGSGGGGEAGSMGSHSGGAGGGGAYSKSVVAVTPGNNYSIDIGTAGTAGTGSGGNGGNGGDTTFATSVVVADGGRGGGITGSGVGGAGGQASASTGQVKRSGGSGGDAPDLSGGGPSGYVPGPGGGGGGGGSARSTSNGQGGADGTATAGGAGGDGQGDGGAGGEETGTNGTAGTAPGGGGGGGGATPSVSGADGDGGAGAAGRAVLTYVEPVDMVPFSCRGASTPIYELVWQDGITLSFTPAGSASTYYTFGDCAPDEWHHVAVTIDWSGSTRIIKGWLDGIQLVDETSSYQPGAETRAVNIGRQATAAADYFEGDISEIVFYDRVLTEAEVLEHFNAGSESLPEQLTSARVDGVLDSVGWVSPAPSIDTGQTTILELAASTDDNALDIIRSADTTEQGLFFIGPDGVPTFRSRHYRLLNQNTSQATFSDDGLNLPYSDIIFSFDNEKLVNDVTVTDGTNEVQLQDSASIAKYGRRSQSFTILTADANELSDTALYLLTKLSEPTLRVDTLVLQPRTDVDLWEAVLGLDIGDLVTVQKTLEGDSIDADFHIEAISHSVSAAKEWTTTWQLSPATEGTFWVLGVAGFSELDETTFLGF